MKVTIKDVAKRAGVSFKTVSRVINNEPTVGEALKKKVWKAVKALDYQPNASARHLRGRLSSIGFVYDNPNSHYVIEMQHGILEECRQRGYELVIHPCDATSKDIVDELKSTIRRAQLAGLVLTPPFSESPAIVDALVKAQVCFVRILSGRAEPDALSPCVYVDDFSAAQEITQYLIDLGHREIGFLGGEDAHKSSGERLKGFKQALKDNQLKVNNNLIKKGKYSFDSGVLRSEKLLTAPQRPTAIFACNDEIAAGALFAARKHGIEVPEELSIVGFEDSPFSRQTWPTLTTARQPIKTIASTAAALLINQLEESNGRPEENKPSNGFVPSLVVRDSTGTANT